jgi:hypothetical protein
MPVAGDIVTVTAIETARTLMADYERLAAGSHARPSCTAHRDRAKSLTLKGEPVGLLVIGGPAFDQSGVVEFAGRSVIAPRRQARARRPPTR